jgi:signal transduction histidine kinase
MAEQAQIYEDSSRQLNAADIAALPAGDFAAMPPQWKIGDTKSAWWLQFDVKNIDNSRLALQFVPGPPFLQRVDFYLQRNGQWLHSRAGQAVPLRLQAQAQRLPSLSFNLHPQESAHILMRIQNNKSIQLQPRLYSEAAYQAWDKRIGLWDGLLFGGLLALGWCALMIALFSRSVSFSWLGLLCIAIALYETSIRGYAKLYLWPQATEWSYRSSSTLGYFSLALFILFIHRLIKREKLSVPGQYYFLGLAALQGAMALVCALGNLHWATESGIYTTLLLSVSLLVTSFTLIRQQAPTGRLMLLTALFFLGHIGLLAMKETGTTPDLLAGLGINTVLGNPAVALIGLAINLTLFGAWIAQVGQQREEAHNLLATWQAQEQQRLTEEVARQTEALNKALAYANEKNVQKTETLGYIGHDLRAPLATIVGYTRLLSAAQTSGQAPYIRAIEHSAQYQLSLIDELLEYATHELKPLELAPSAVPMTTLLEDISQYATALSAQHNNLFACHIPTALPATVFLDGRRLQQILLNLLSNAAKYTKNGTIQLSVDAHDSDKGWALRFSVADSGIGIDASTHSTIFNAFEQIQPRPGCVGLGLFIAQRIVEHMGGTLQLNSKLGAGSRFSFEITVPALDDHTIAWEQAITRMPNPAGELTAAPHDMYPVPPAHTRLELAVLARDGHLTDIENWIDRMSEFHPRYHEYVNAIQCALQILDFEKIEVLALSASH